MSSGTQIDLDWTGIDAAQGGASAPPVTAPNATGSGAGAYLTDEEILGIAPVGQTLLSVPESPTAGADALKNSSDAARSGVPRLEGQAAPRGASGQGVPVLPEAMPQWMQALAGDPKHGAEAQQLWEEHQAFRAAFSSPEEARAIKEMFPGGVQEVQALKQASQSVDRIDAAIFSGDPRAQSEVVAELARANPAAFRAMFVEAAKVLGVGQTLLSVPEDATAIAGATKPSSDAALNAPRLDGQARVPVLPDARANANAAPQFDPAAYASFERSTNDAVARDVRSTIHDTLARVLPEGVAEGAARRVVGEWTSSVLGTARSKAARQAVAASRVDIAAAGGSLDSMPLRAMSPREVDYASMSDDEILGM